MDGDKNQALNRSLMFSPKVEQDFETDFHYNKIPLPFI